MNCLYYGTALKLTLHIRTGKLIQFYVSIRCIHKNWSPINKENKLAEAVTLSEKRIHRMDHVSSSNAPLFLTPLIINLLYAIVPSFFPQVACTFHKRSTNRVWSSKRSGFIYWILGGPDSCFVEGWGYVALVTLYVSSYLWQRIEKSSP